MASAGCNSPTLPLPPPDSPQIADISPDGLTVHLLGAGAYPGALVVVFNDDLQKGVIVTAAPNGAYDAVVPTDLQRFQVNELEMWQRVGAQDSSVIVFLVPLHGTFNPAVDAGRSDDAEAPQDAGMAGGEP
jgi:hypothetical protein